jgi:hypothetical protein
LYDQFGPSFFFSRLPGTSVTGAVVGLLALALSHSSSTRIRHAARFGRNLGRLRGALRYRHFRYV